MSFDLFTIGARRAAFAPEDEGAAGGGDQIETGEGAAGADAGTAATAGEGKGEGEGEGAAASSWWEDKRFSEEQRTSLAALGLTVDDPLDAVAKLTDMERAAKKHLRAKPESLIQKPEEGQSLAEWRKANAEIFGVPEAPDDYKIEKPEGWPKEAPWNDKLEARLREAAHQRGLDGETVQDFVNLYAEDAATRAAEAEAEFAAANTEMRAALEKDWGDQLDARLERAGRGAAALAQQAGLGEKEILQLSNVLEKTLGHANVIKIFDAAGAALAEDTLASGGAGSGVGQTPAEARAELAQMQSDGGEWWEATKKKDRAKIEELKPRMERLRKIAARK